MKKDFCRIEPPKRQSCPGGGVPFFRALSVEQLGIYEQLELIRSQLESIEARVNQLEKVEALEKKI